MAKVASIGCPGDVSIVAGTTELSIHDISHLEIVAPYAHLEAELGMAYLAAKTDTMKPMRKDHRSHPLPFRAPIEYDVAILGRGPRHHTGQSDQQQQ